MSRSHQIACRWLLGIALVLAGPSARAGMTWTVSVDTSQLAADYTGPFALDFELVGSNGNTVTLNSFSFGAGGGAGPGPAFLTGGASGDLGTSVSLTDSVYFFSDFNQQFTPGNTLTFSMESTLNGPPAGGTPDSFSMVIFSAYDPVDGYNPFTGTGGTPIPTTDPTGNDTFFNFNINGPGSTTVSTYPSASGDVTITVTPTSAIPEPPSGVLALLSVVCLLSAVCRQRMTAGGGPGRGERQPSPGNWT